MSAAMDAIEDAIAKEAPNAAPAKAVPVDTGEVVDLDEPIIDHEPEPEPEPETATEPVEEAEPAEASGDDEGAEEAEEAEEQGETEEASEADEDDEDKPEELEEKDFPTTKEGVQRLHKNLAKRQKKVKLRLEERQEFERLKEDVPVFENIRRYAVELEDKAKEHTAKLSEWEEAASHPMKLLEKAGFTSDDFVAVFADSSAVTPAMKAKLEERQGRAEQQRTAREKELERQLMAERQRNDLSQVSSRVSRVVSPDRTPHIMAELDANPNLLDDMSRRILDYAYRTGDNSLDIGKEIGRLEVTLRQRAERHAKALGLDLAPSRGETPKTKPESEPKQPKPVSAREMSRSDAEEASVSDDDDLDGEDWLDLEISRAASRT